MSRHVHGILASIQKHTEPPVYQATHPKNVKWNKYVAQGSHHSHKWEHPMYTEQENSTSSHHNISSLEFSF